MNEKSLEKYIKELSKATPEQKDLIIARMLVILEKLASAMVAANPTPKKLNKEIKEIEDTISLGIPGWIKYTRKVKKRKK